MPFTDGVLLTAEDVAAPSSVPEPRSGRSGSRPWRTRRAAVDAITCEDRHSARTMRWHAAVVGIVPAHAYGPDYGESTPMQRLHMAIAASRWILRANPDYDTKPP